MKLSDLNPKMRLQAQRQISRQLAADMVACGLVDSSSEAIAAIVGNNTQSFRAIVDPMGAPRQTRRDAWRPSKAVLRYRKFKDELRAVCGKPPVPVRLELEFDVPMPRSWSRRKRQLMQGTPHRSRPDVDNMAKAVMDALWTEDGAVAELAARKRWSATGEVRVRLIYEPEK